MSRKKFNFQQSKFFAHFLRVEPQRLSEAEFEILKRTRHVVDQHLDLFRRNDFRVHLSNRDCECHSLDSPKLGFLEAIGRLFYIKIKLFTVWSVKAEVQCMYINPGGKGEVSLLRLPLFSSKLVKLKTRLQEYLRKAQNKGGSFEMKNSNLIDDRLKKINSVIDSLGNYAFFACEDVNSTNFESKKSLFDESLKEIMQLRSLYILEVALKQINQGVVGRHRVFCKRIRNVEILFHGFHRFAVSPKGVFAFKQSIQKSLDLEESEQNNLDIKLNFQKESVKKVKVNKINLEFLQNEKTSKSNHLKSVDSSQYIIEKNASSCSIDSLFISNAPKNIEHINKIKNISKCEDTLSINTNFTDKKVFDSQNKLKSSCNGLNLYNLKSKRHKKKKLIETLDKKTDLINPKKINNID